MVERVRVQGLGIKSGLQVLYWVAVLKLNSIMENESNGCSSKLWSFFGCPKYEVPYYSRDPKRDHDFDNHPSGQQELQSEMDTPFIQGLHGDFRNFSSGDHSSKETNLI